MFRPLTLVTLCAAAGAGLYLYQVGHSVSQLDRELRDINRRTTAGARAHPGAARRMGVAERT